MKANSRRFSEMNIVNESFENMIPRFAAVVNTCLNNLPNTKDMDPPQAEEALIEYLSFFWLKNVSFSEEFQDVASISSISPLCAFQSILSCLPDRSSLLDSRTSFLSLLDPNVLKHPLAKSVVRLMMDVAQAVFLEQVMSRPVFLLPDDGVHLFKLVYEVIVPSGDEELNGHVYYVSSVFWSNALYHMSSLLNDEILEALIDFLEHVPKMNCVKATALFTFFSGFMVKDIGDKAYKEFAKSLKNVLKYVKKNAANSRLEWAFIEFCKQFMTAVSALKDNTANEWKVIASYAKSCMSRNEYSGKAFELYALYLTYNEETPKAYKQFIENDLIPRLSKGNALGYVLMGMVFLLRGKNYERGERLQKTQNNLSWRNSPDFVQIDVLDDFVSKIMERGTMFEDCQVPLASFFIQLAVFDFAHFMNTYFDRLIDVTWMCNNSIAVLKTLSYMIAFKQLAIDRNSSLRLLQAASRSVNSFLKESTIRLAPTGMQILNVGSFVSGIQLNSAKPEVFLLNHREFSTPLVPNLWRSGEKLDIIHKWKKKAAKLTNIFERAPSQLNVISGYIPPRSLMVDQETIEYLSIAGLTTRDSKTAGIIAGFVLSSSPTVRAVAIHVLQAIVHNKNVCLAHVIKNVCDLIRLCPVYESEDLYMILYALLNILDSAVYLRMSIPDDAMTALNSVVVLGLCDPHTFVRKLAFQIAVCASHFQEVSFLSVIEKNIEQINRETNENILLCLCIDEEEGKNIENLNIKYALNLNFDNIWKFYLATLGKHLRLNSEDIDLPKIRKTLISLLGLFEHESVSKSFISSIVVFLVNSACDVLEPLLLQLCRSQDTAKLPALFSAIDPSLVGHAFVPASELLGPVSFGLCVLGREPHYDLQFAIELLNKLVTISVDACNFSKEVENGVEPSTFYLLHATTKIFGRFWETNASYRHVEFPLIRKATTTRIDEGNWIAFLLLCSCCRGVITKYTVNAFNSFLKIVKTSTQMLDSLLTLKQMSCEHPVEMAFLLLHYPSLLESFLDSACKEVAYFTAVADQVEYSASLDELEARFELHSKATTKDDDDSLLATNLYDNAGSVIGLACCYMESTCMNTRKSAMNLYLTTVYTYARINGKEITGDLFELEKFLPGVLVSVLRKRLLTQLNMLAELFPNLSEPFVRAVLQYNMYHNKRDLSLILPWLKGLSTSDLVSEKGCLSLSSFVSWMSTLDFHESTFEVFKRLEAGELIEHVVAIILEIGEKPWCVQALLYMISLHRDIVLGLLFEKLSPEYWFRVCKQEKDEEEYLMLAKFIIRVLVEYVSTFTDTIPIVRNVVIPCVIAVMPDNDELGSHAKSVFTFSPAIWSNEFVWRDEADRKQFAKACLKWGLICRNISQAKSALRVFLEFNMSVDGFGAQIIQVITTVNMALSDTRLDLDEYMTCLLAAVKYTSDNDPQHVFMLEKYLPTRLFGATAAASIIGLVSQPEYAQVVRESTQHGQILREILSVSHLDQKTYPVLKDLVRVTSKNELWHLLTSSEDKGLLRLLLIKPFVFACDTTESLIEYLEPEIRCRDMSDLELVGSLSTEEMGIIMKFITSNNDFLTSMRIYPFVDLLLKCGHPFDSDAFSEIVNYEIVNLRCTTSDEVLEFLSAVVKIGGKVTRTTPPQGQGHPLPELPPITNVVSPSFVPFSYDISEALSKFAKLIMSKIPTIG